MKAPSTIEQKKEKHIARQKKYYEKNKSEILTKLKEKKTNLKILIETPTDIWYDIRVINEYFQSLSTTGKKITQKTVDDHRGDLIIIYRAFNLSERDCIMKFILKNNIQKIITNLETVHSSRFKKPYSISSVVSFVHTILLIFDLFETNSPSVREMLDKKKQEISIKLLFLKNKYETYTQDKKSSDSVLFWPDLGKRIIEKFSENSKENIIIQLYNTLCARDDFYLKKVQNEDDAKNEDTNYIIIPENVTKKVSIVLNRYKTKQIYGVQKKDMTLAASKIVRKYIDDDNSESTHLFPEKKLSPFITKMLKKINIVGNSNYFRRSISSSKPEDELDTLDKKTTFALFLMHSVETQEKNYKVTLIRD